MKKSSIPKGILETGPESNRQRGSSRTEWKKEIPKERPLQGTRHTNKIVDEESHKPTRVVALKHIYRYNYLF